MKKGKRREFKEERGNGEKKGGWREMGDGGRREEDKERGGDEGR